MELCENCKAHGKDDTASGSVIAFFRTALQNMSVLAEDGTLPPVRAASPPPAGAPRGGASTKGGHKVATGAWAQLVQDKERSHGGREGTAESEKEAKLWLLGIDVESAFALLWAR